MEEKNLWSHGNLWKDARNNSTYRVTFFYDVIYLMAGIIPQVSTEQCFQLPGKETERTQNQ